MNYTINPASFSSVFTLPCSVVDEHLKLASDTQIKVLLYIFRNLSSGINPDDISKGLGIALSEVTDCLLYWSQTGVLKSENETAQTTQSTTPTLKVQKPTRADVAKRGFEDPKIKFLMQEAQQRFGRTLKSNEQSTLLWLYDDQGLEVSVILMLLQFAVSENSLNIRYIEKTALAWVEKGVKTVVDAEKQIAQMLREKAAWRVVEKAFGIDRRQPSTKELELSILWVEEWKLSNEMLRLAYDACIDSKSKFSIPYIAKILENWHKQGFNTPEDVKTKQQPNKAKDDNNFAAYDIDAFEKSLFSDDD